MHVPTNSQGLNKPKPHKHSHFAIQYTWLLCVTQSCTLPTEVRILSPDPGLRHPSQENLKKKMLIPLRNDFLDEGIPNC